MFVIQARLCRPVTVRFSTTLKPLLSLPISVKKKCVVVPADKASNKIVQRTLVITTLFVTKDVAVN